MLKNSRYISSPSPISLEMSPVFKPHALQGLRFRIYWGLRVIKNLVCRLEFRVLGLGFRIKAWRFFERPSLPQWVWEQLPAGRLMKPLVIWTCQSPEALAPVSYGTHHYFTPVPVPSFRASSPHAPCTLPGIARCVPAVPASPPSLCVILLTLHASVARVCGTAPTRIRHQHLEFSRES